MPSSDKTKENLMASMIKSKTGATQEKTSAKPASQPAKKTGGSKQAASTRKSRPAKKKSSKSVLPDERRLQAADPYQSRGRIWPD